MNRAGPAGPRRPDRACRRRAGARRNHSGVTVENHRSWLIALRAPGLGGARLLKLAKQHGGMDGLVCARPSDLRQSRVSEEAVDALLKPDQQRLEEDLEWLSEPDHYLLTPEVEQFPPLLKTIPSPPAALFIAGDPDLLWQPQVAVIGSRNPTAGGRDNARDFATELSRRGMAITSGLASGIDSVAHAAALDAGGITIAVLGTGVDRVYPAGGAALAARIGQRGALVSEFPLGTPARRSNFPSRNRIISGLSLGVLVIEAGLRSGTLITARMAGNQGREVFALPGSIHNPLAKGCHRLIRDGARLVESIEQIMEELAPLAGRLADQLRGELATVGMTSEDAGLASDPAQPQIDSDPEYRRLWSCLGYDPKPVDLIIEQSGLTARAVSAMLLLLELRGMVEAHPGGAFSRRTRGQE